MRYALALAALFAQFASTCFAGADLTLEPTPPFVDPWVHRQKVGISWLCYKNEANLDPRNSDNSLKPLALTEDSAQTALTKLVDGDCGRAAHTRFDPGPDSDPPSLHNRELVNMWLNGLADAGEVGTDMSSYAHAANLTMQSVLAAVAAHSVLGIPFPPALDPLVLPVTVLSGVLQLTGTCNEIHDYDMGLVGLIRILYLYGQFPNSKIDRPIYNQVIDRMLTQTGGADQWSDHPHICGIALPIPETENHIWMTESSRYLTNQLIRLRLNPDKIDAIDKDTKYVYVNEKNGLKFKILQKLQSILAEDFHEYNARPYARFTAYALENLFDFAEDREVRRGARMALDYLSGKFAVSSSESRRAVPYRRLRDTETTTSLFGEQRPAGQPQDVPDEETFRFLQLSGAIKVLTSDHQGGLSGRAAGTMLMTSTSYYRVPPLIDDLIVNGENKSAYFQQFKHEAYELYVGRPKYLISAGGVFRPGWEPKFLGHVAIEVITAELTGQAILGPILPEPALAAIASSGNELDTASSLPTTLMPAVAGTDRSDFIRIEGTTDRSKRNNTCIFPDGFACGLNPVIPQSINAACLRQLDNWTFVNFNAGGDCGREYGLYVVFWKAACDDSHCSENAGGADPSYGFFEVIEASADITFNLVVSRTLTNNKGRTFTSRGLNYYKSFSGAEIRFEPDVPIDTWSIFEGDVRDMRQWREARGNIMNNLFPIDDNGNAWRYACVEIDNPTKQKRRILDFSWPDDPRWCEVDLTMPFKFGCSRERCPLTDKD